MSFGWAVFRQGGAVVARRLLGSTFDPAGRARRGRDERPAPVPGRRGDGYVGFANGVNGAFGAVLKDDRFNAGVGLGGGFGVPPARRRRPPTTATGSSPTTRGTPSGAISVRGRYYALVPASRVVTAPSREALLSRPEPRRSPVAGPRRGGRPARRRRRRLRAGRRRQARRRRLRPPAGRLDSLSTRRFRQHRLLAWGGGSDLLVRCGDGLRRRATGRLGARGQARPRDPAAEAGAPPLVGRGHRPPRAAHALGDRAAAGREAAPPVALAGTARPPRGDGHLGCRGVPEPLQPLLPAAAPRAAEAVVRGLGLRDEASLPADGRPRVVGVMIASADGRAAVGGRSGPLGPPVRPRLLRAVREEVDAVLVGPGTLRAEGYANLLDPDAAGAAGAGGRAGLPDVATISRSLDVPTEVGLFAEPEATARVYTAREGAVASRGATVHVHALGDPAPRAVLGHLRAETGARAVAVRGRPDAAARARRRWLPGRPAAHRRAAAGGRGRGPPARGPALTPPAAPRAGGRPARRRPPRAALPAPPVSARTLRLRRPRGGAPRRGARW